jgi:hypothetical protein
MEELNLSENQIKILSIMEEYIMQAYDAGFKAGYKLGQSLDSRTNTQ